jgi:hypothetical protein
MAQPRPRATVAPKRQASTLAGLGPAKRWAAPEWRARLHGDCSATVGRFGKADDVDDHLGADHRLAVGLRHGDLADDATCRLCRDRPCVGDGHDEPDQRERGPHQNAMPHCIRGALSM